MSARQDNVNLILTINAVQSAKTLQEMEKSARDLRRLLQKIPVDSAEFREASKKLQDLDTRIKQTKSGMTAMRQETGLLSSTIAKATGIIGAIIIGVRGFFSALSGSAKLEQLNIAFEVFLGSAEKAKKVVADLRKFADVTPFETDEVNKAGRALLAFGFSAEELIPTLTRVGDVAAGTGKDFNELALIYGKARAEGIIQNDTLNQLAEAGIPVYEELAKILDVDTSKIRKLAESGEIGFDKLQQVFVNLTSEGGRFAGLMERQSQSLDGLFSTLVSAIRNKVTSAMNDLLPVIKSITKGFIDLLSVPVSETLEKERQSFNGVALSILNANVGSTERTKAIKTLQEQYPAFLGNINAEKATNEQLKPILEQINQSYVIRIALQKQQEKIQPLLEARAEQENRLAEGRAAANRLLARGAELAGVNLQQFKTQAEQTQAVLDALGKTAQFREGVGFSQPLNEQARILNEIRGTASQIDATTIRQKRATEDATEAERQRQEVISELRKTYGEVFKILDQESTQTTTTSGGKAQEDAKERAKKLKEAIDLELQQIDIRFAKEEIAALKLKNDGILKDETQFGNVMLQLQEQQLEAQLAVYRSFGQEQTKEALELQKKLLEIQSGRNIQKPAELAPLPSRTPGAVSSQTAGANAAGVLAGLDETTVLRDKFAQLIDLEQNHELRIAEIRKNAADARLRFLQEQGLKETEEYKQALDDKAKADDEFQAKLKDNERRTSEFKQKLHDIDAGLFNDAVDFGIQLLSKDEAARKKYSAAIKAFQIGEVLVSGYNEIQKIYLKYAAYPAGGLLAQAEAIPAGIRTAFAVAKIATTKFAGGGFTGPGFGQVPDNTGHRPVGVVHAHEWVSPPWMTQHPVYGEQIRMLESIRQRGFADGGFATTPTVNVLPAASAGSAAVQNVEMFGVLADEFRQFRREVRDWQGRLRVAYTDIEEAGHDLSAVRAEASI